MDPPLVNESSFTAASNPSSYSLVELLSFPMGGNGGLGLTMASLGDGSLDESTVTDNSGNGGPKRRRDNQDMNELNGKRSNASRSREEDGVLKTEPETNSGNSIKQSKTEAPKDYIHVRARRGQATDSHSLAERARREKISERMKILQDLVPGCNKVIGKALVLDEIINYIQSLQRQVEFMSMKLEAVTSRMNPAIEGYPTKDLSPAFDGNGMMYGSQAQGEYAQGAQAEWLHMQLGSAFDRAT